MPFRVARRHVLTGNIFELMPFENELIVLKLNGTLVKKIFNFIASKDGAPLAGAKFGIKNNEAVVLTKLGRFKEAHKHLDQAREITVRFKHRTLTAQFDSTRAELLIAEGKFKDAERKSQTATPNRRSRSQLPISSATHGRVNFVTAYGAREKMWRT